MARPRGPNPATLAAHNVTMTIDGWGAYRFTCGQCGATWPIFPPPAGGRLPPRYWQCPHGCNAPAAPDQAASTDNPPAIPTDLATLPAILTPAEAAALLRLAETTVKDLARAGELPGAFKLGKLWRVERDALLAYIGRTRGKPGDDQAPPP